MDNQHLAYWAAIYNQLNRQHELWQCHKITFDEFMTAPEHYQHWITVYFANPALLINRLNGAPVNLVFFIAQPDFILLSALMAETLRTEFLPAQRELLPKQSVAAAMVQWTDSPVGKHGRFRGNRYVQALKRHGHACIGKYKTRGGHRKQRVV